jgi:hypothetical protein
MEADVVGAGVGERLGQRIDRLHHQVHVDRHRLARRGLRVRLSRPSRSSART